MRYDFSVIVPADTSQDAPLVQLVKLDAGTLKRCQVQFLAGCHNHVFLTVNDSEFQIVPANGTQAMFGDFMIHDVPLDYKINSSGYHLTIKAWSPGTRYEHSLTVMLTVEQDDSKVAQQFYNLLSGLQAGQA